MPHRPIRIKDWIRFLKAIGLVELPGTSGTSHCQWNYPKESGMSLSRPITFRKSEKDIPALHIKTCLRTLNMTWEDMERTMKS